MFIKEIEKIQKYFTRRLFMKIRPNEPRLSYAERMELFKFKSLEFLIIKTELGTLFKLMKGLIPVPFDLKFSTRSHGRSYYRALGTQAPPVFFKITIEFSD